ncbi:MAG: sulfatase [Deltaproteobacteria bacterium]|nr:sulfatase [Deltaproteobacteria bacterium]
MVMQWLFLAATLTSAIPDHSDGYFPDLTRTRVENVKVSGEGGPVILVVVDAMRPDRMSTYGFERETTPHLSKLADDGVIFTNYYVNGNWTRPTSTTMLTGLPPVAHRVEKQVDRLAHDIPTLAQTLAANGIPAGAVVGNGNAGSVYGLDRGFTYYADTVKHWKGLPTAQNVVDLGLPFIEKNQNDPFFLMLFMVDPHDPYGAPGPYENYFVKDKSVRLIRTPHWEKGNYSKAEVERMKATYDGSVRYVDETLGKLFSKLKKMGLYDKSTIIVTSDHGEAFGEHGVFMHSHHLYDEIIRAPLIIKPPSISKKAGYNHYLFDSTDLMPTVLGWYQVAPLTKLPGVDIIHSLENPSANDPHRRIVTEFNHFGIHRATVRSYTGKVIYSAPVDEKEFRSTVGNRSLLPSVSFDKEWVRMYDLSRDPFEKNCLYNEKPAQFGHLSKLLKEIRSYRAGRPSKPSVPATAVDAETLKDLKTMGYVD